VAAPNQAQICAELREFKTTPSFFVFRVTGDNRQYCRVAGNSPATRQLTASGDVG
jgi:hypothetical protein